MEGVPQGSVIGPLSFTLYSLPLESIIESHGIDKMIYADDTQVYVVLKCDNTCKSSAAVSKLELCVKDIKVWSTANHWKLNEEKTVVLHIKSRFRMPSDLLNIQIGDSTVESTSCARILEVQF